MKAYALAGFDAPAAVQDVPVPPLGPGDVRVRVRAASINGFDAWVVTGMAKDMMEHRFPVTIGKDFAGVVEEVGEQVTRWRTGDEVLGITPPSMQVLDHGSFAEHVVVPAEGFIERKPTAIDLRAAGALGLAGLAALVSVEAVAPTKDDRVLVAGATGGVGSYAVQLAAARGATVIATGLPEDEAWLRELGAAETVDYSSDVVGTLRERYPDGIEGLIDLVNRGEDFTRVAELVKSGGRIATTLGAADVEQLAARGVTANNVFAQADPAAFARLVEIAAEGKVAAAITRTFSLADVGEGLDLMRQGKARGKYIVMLEG